MREKKKEEWTRDVESLADQRRTGTWWQSPSGVTLTASLHSNTGLLCMLSCFTVPLLTQCFRSYCVSTVFLPLHVFGCVFPSSNLLQSAQVSLSETDPVVGEWPAVGAWPAAGARSDVGEWLGCGLGSFALNTPFYPHI